MAIMFRNLTGANFATMQKYTEYVQRIIKEITLQYGKIELVADGVTVQTGEIRKTL